MASSLLSFCSLNKPLCRPKGQKYSQVRSQSFMDEGKSANIVDANLRILRERIEEVKKKERLNTCSLQNGWTYQAGYDHKHKRAAILSESIQLIGTVSGALGLVFFSGSFLICLVSILVHLSLL
ncbi:uncharacterized protein LOC104881607 [Vitis vinifera]|uniref:Uncharacterized protein n=1 Tax=Vitis vinifera TaxID=29760 RepID=A0A438C1B9_VITVI|nr:uncharacterized protein LOC104881607 [Vitis vinifera]RVW17030.1 hypothetical protein CK203_070691 [Vitis vinifera]|eukprot:XP_010660511.1 PREDICTED: uncharacterized protein LOC104881607 isoform X1 [Vitis vinifera]